MGRPLSIQTLHMATSIVITDNLINERMILAVQTILYNDSRDI